MFKVCHNVLQVGGLYPFLQLEKKQLICFLLIWQQSKTTSNALNMLATVTLYLCHADKNLLERVWSDRKVTEKDCTRLIYDWKIGLGIFLSLVSLGIFEPRHF